jgi:predicted metal-dependent phosphoesterase TrpH
VILNAKEAGLSTISITDHDSIDALDEAFEQGKKNSIQVIPGIEFSADLDGKEVHILAYFIDHKDEAFLKYVMDLRQGRFDRFKKMILKLNELDCNIEFESVINGYPKHISFGRPHLAASLLKQGFVKSYAEAFYKYIGDNRPAHVRKPNPPVNEVINKISKYKGQSFVAHPGKYFRESLLKQLMEQGIDGIEVTHPSHSTEDKKYFSKFAAENNLLKCGGSDFHGTTQNEFKNLGEYFITEKEIINMRIRLEQIKIF